MSNIKKNFIYNSFYQVLTILTPLLTTPYISRVLGAGGIGVFSYEYSIASYFQMFAILGMSNYGRRSIAEVHGGKDELSATFWSIYAVQFFFSIIVIFAYLFYIIAFAETKILGYIMLTYVVAGMFDINWFYFGLEKFKFTTIRNTIIKFLTVFSIFVFVQSENDIFQYSAIYCVGALISQLFLWLYLPKYISLVRIHFVDCKKHIIPNFILFIPIIAVSLYKTMDKIMLGYMTNLRQVGLYQNSENILQVPMSLVQSLGAVMMPRIANIISSKQSKENVSEYMRKSIAIALFIASSIGFGIMTVGQEFVSVFFGPGFEECVLLLDILLPSCIFLAFANVIRTQYLIPYKRDKIFVITVFYGAIVNLIMNYILIPRYQCFGAAVATFFAEFVVCISQSIYVRKNIEIHNYIRISIPFVMSGVIMFILIHNVFYYVGNIFLRMFIKIILGIMVYFVSLILLLYIGKKIGWNNSLSLNLLKQIKKTK